MGGNHGTIGLIVALAIGFVLCWIPQFGSVLTPNLSFDFNFTKPWAILTYPFVTNGSGQGLLFFILQLMWLYSFGGLFENRFGTQSLLIHFFSGTLLFAFFGFLAHVLIPDTAAVLIGAWLPIAFITTVICGLQPETEITFFFFPLKMKWLALLTAGLVLFGFGTGAPLFGVLLVLPLVAAWFYGQNKFPGLTPGRSPFEKQRQKAKENREFDSFRSKVIDREKERQERERLRKLFEGSLDDQDPPQTKN
jgi:membrane associated rhomboid family serine protease